MTSSLEIATAGQKIDLNRLESILSKYYKRGRDALISVLQEVQVEYGRIPQESIEPIADTLNLFPSEVYGVVTFYPQFSLTPQGKCTIQACRGTTCHVKGADKIISTIENTTKLKEGETSSDLKFTFKTVTCVGTCALAPVMVINNKFLGKLYPKKVADILSQYEKG
ncbi:TPA: NAD(P)H-dependent oxidoreductase subunit E [bacterium]|nr:NAD(P)H-dependent oxidoreductase subunit E [bacterium]